MGSTATRLDVGGEHLGLIHEIELRLLGNDGIGPPLGFSLSFVKTHGLLICVIRQLWGRINTLGNVNKGFRLVGRGAGLPNAVDRVRILQRCMSVVTHSSRLLLQVVCLSSILRNNFEINRAFNRSLYSTPVVLVLNQPRRFLEIVSYCLPIFKFDIDMS